MAHINKNPISSNYGILVVAIWQIEVEKYSTMALMVRREKKMFFMF